MQQLTDVFFANAIETSVLEGNLDYGEAWRLQTILRDVADRFAAHGRSNIDRTRARVIGAVADAVQGKLMEHPDYDEIPERDEDSQG